MQKGNVNGAVKLLTNNMQNAILPLNEETINMLRLKHPDASHANEEALLPDVPENIHPIIFEKIDSEAVRKAALKTKGGSGPSGMDGDGWRRIFVGSTFGQSSVDICKSFASVIRKLCIVPDLHDSLEAFLSCRLIPLDKNPGLRPIGVGEILRRIAGKAIVSALREDIIKSVGSLQVCAGHEAGCEAAVHAMNQIFKENDTEAVLLIDASNAFNSANRSVFLHNISIVCPTVATYVKNCYSQPSRLFIIGGCELKSSEGTTQGYPIAMAIYAIAIIPLMLMVLDVSDKLPDKRTKMTAYADDFSAGGSIINLKHWWDTLCKLGPKFGYFPEASKCWLIIKPEAAEKAHTIFKDTEIQITKRGKRHLGAIIGTDGYRDEYVLDKINRWSSELQLLCEIAKIEPQAAYSCFVSGYKHKLTYYMRTIPGISHLLQCIDDIILTEFIPAITGGIKVNQTERILISLPVKYGGLGIPIFSEVSDQEYSNSLVVTENLCKKILAQHRQFEHDPERNKKKNKIKNEKKKKFKATLDDLKLEMNTDKIRLNEIHQEIGSSSWLTSLPLKDEGYVVNKQSFWDLIRIRYGWELSRLPDKNKTCECGRNTSLI